MPAARSGVRVSGRPAAGEHRRRPADRIPQRRRRGPPQQQPVASRSHSSRSGRSPPSLALPRDKSRCQDVGRELNVQAVVTGTLRQEATNLSISVALVDAREDSLLWGQQLPGKAQRHPGPAGPDRPRPGWPTSGLRLTGDEEQRLTKRHTEDPKAYLLYREGMYHWHKFTRGSIAHGHRVLRAGPQEGSTITPVAHEGLGHGAMCVRESTISVAQRDSAQSASSPREGPEAGPFARRCPRRPGPSRHGPRAQLAGGRARTASTLSSSTGDRRTLITCMAFTWRHGAGSRKQLPS